MSGAADLLRFLSAGPEERKRVIDGVIVRGGLSDSGGRFVEPAKQARSKGIEATVRTAQQKSTESTEREPTPK
jgi:hypothetical protein